MRKFGLALMLLAAIPAAALPLLAGVVMLSMPAALIAGAAALGGHHSSYSVGDDSWIRHDMPSRGACSVSEPRSAPDRHELPGCSVQARR